MMRRHADDRPFDSFDGSPGWMPSSVPTDVGGNGQDLVWSRLIPPSAPMYSIAHPRRRRLEARIRAQQLYSLYAVYLMNP